MMPYVRIYDFIFSCHICIGIREMQSSHTFDVMGFDKAGDKTRNRPNVMSIAFMVPSSSLAGLTCIQAVKMWV